MRKFILMSVLIITVGFASAGWAQVKHLRVMFYSVQARGKAWNKMMCRAYYRDSDFTNDGKVDHFPQKANPRFYDHQLTGSLPIKKDGFLQAMTIKGAFDYAGKHYDLLNTIASYTRKDPLLVRGIISNQYCRAAYFVVENKPNQLGSFAKI